MYLKAGSYDNKEKGTGAPPLARGAPEERDGAKSYGVVGREDTAYGSGELGRPDKNIFENDRHTSHPNDIRNSKRSQVC